MVWPTLAAKRVPSLTPPVLWKKESLEICVAFNDSGFLMIDDDADWNRSRVLLRKHGCWSEIDLPCELQARSLFLLVFLYFHNLSGMCSIFQTTSPMFPNLCWFPPLNLYTNFPSLCSVFSLFVSEQLSSPIPWPFFFCCFHLFPPQREGVVI